MTQQAFLTQAVRYGGVGLVNTAIGLSTILLLQEVARFGPFAANIGGYVVGLAVSFALNRAWTFGTRNRVGARLVRFLVSFALAYGVNLATLALLIAQVGPMVAQVAAVIVYSVLFFILCRLVVFAP